METKNDFVYKPVIKKIIRDLLHTDRQDTSRFLPFRLKKDTFLRYDQYVQILYRDMFTEPTAYDFMTIMYREILSQQDVIKLSPKNSCTFKIEFDFSELKIEYRYSTKDYPVGKYKGKFGMSDKEGIKSLAKTILLIGSECKFFVIDFAIFFGEVSAHSNIAFVENIGDNSDPKLILNYYEPHGYSNRVNGIIRILEELEIASEQRISVHYNRHLYTGAQTYSQDTTGYCVMFSIFWVYVVLNIVVYNINNSSYIPSTYWIDKVEEYYITVLRSEEMYDIVVLFARDQFNNYVNTLSSYKVGRYIVKRLFARIMQSVKDGNLSVTHIDELYPDPNDPRRLEVENLHAYETDVKDQTDIVPEISSEKLSLLASEDPEYTYEAWEKARYDERKEMKALKQFRKQRGYDKSEYPAKLRLGKSCKRNSDCQSKRCIIDNETGECYCGAPLRSSKTNE